MIGLRYLKTILNMDYEYCPSNTGLHIYLTLSMVEHTNLDVIQDERSYWSLEISLWRTILCRIIVAPFPLRFYFIATCVEKVRTYRRNIVASGNLRKKNSV